MLKKIAVLTLSLLTFLSCFGIIVFADENDDIAYPRHVFEYDEYALSEALENEPSMQSDNAFFRDEAELFSSDEKREDIFRLIQETADEIDMNVAVFIGGLYRNDTRTEDFTAQASEYLFGMEDGVNTVFLYLDFEGWNTSYDFIDTYHDAFFYYPDTGSYNRIDKILDHMYQYLPASGETIYRSSVEKAIQSFLSDLKYYKNQGMVGNETYYNEETSTYRFSVFGVTVDSPIPPYKHIIPFLVIGIAAGIFTGISEGKRIRNKYKFREGERVTVYTSNNRMTMNEMQDTLIDQHTNSHRISSNSSSHSHRHHSSSHSHSHSRSHHRSSSHRGGGRHR